MPRVKLPDGTYGVFPDDMSDAEIEAVLQKQFPPTQPQAEAPPEPSGGPDAPGYLRRFVPAALEGGWETAKEMVDPSMYIESAKALYKLAKPPQYGVPYEGAEVAGNIAGAIGETYDDAVSGDPERQGKLAGGLLTSWLGPKGVNKVAGATVRAAGRGLRSAKVATAAGDVERAAKLAKDAKAARAAIEAEDAARDAAEYSGKVRVENAYPELRDTMFAKDSVYADLSPEEVSARLGQLEHAENVAGDAASAAIKEAAPKVSAIEELAQKAMPLARFAMGPAGRGVVGGMVGGWPVATAAVVGPPAMRAAVRRIPWRTVQAMAERQGVLPEKLMQAMKAQGIVVTFDNSGQE